MEVVLLYYVCFYSGSLYFDILQTNKRGKREEVSQQMNAPGKMWGGDGGERESLSHPDIQEGRLGARKRKRAGEGGTMFFPASTRTRNRSRESFAATILRRYNETSSSRPPR